MVRDVRDRNFICPITEQTCINRQCAKDRFCAEASAEDARREKAEKAELDIARRHHLTSKLTKYLLTRLSDLD
jgi:hypothetical protein